MPKKYPTRKHKNRVDAKKVAAQYLHMNTPRDILDTLGREAVAVALDVNLRRVNRAALEEKLPALWYRKLCDMSGQTLPIECFTAKGYGDAA